MAAVKFKMPDREVGSYQKPKDYLTKLVPE